MPTIEISKSDLENLLNKKNIDLDTALMFAKGEIDESDDDLLKVDIKDTNRPDLWSIEGIAREIGYRFGRKISHYKTKKSGLKVYVDPLMKNIRPYTACAVVKNIKITDSVLSQIIQLQEKSSTSYGLNRKDVAIGIYDFNKIKGDIFFKAFSPDEIKFKPLDFEEELILSDILKKHPKGIKYGYLLKDMKKYPVFTDSENNVLSMPPIINSDYSGKVDTNTKNVFIECSGFDFKKIMTMINVISTSLYERGGKIFTCDVIYPDKTITTPDLHLKEIILDADYIKKTTGIEFKNNLKDLLIKSGYDVNISGKKIILKYPPYRSDIMHQRDVIEDLLITYGYNKIKPTMRQFPSQGKLIEIEKFSELLKQIGIGMGCQEVLTYTLTNKENLFKKMRLTNKNLIEISNPTSSNWSVFRTWLIPSLMEFLSKNKHNEYPQKIFEVGKCTLLNKHSETLSEDKVKFAMAICSSKCGYHTIASYLDFLMTSLGIKYKLLERKHASFIDGRCSSIFIENNEIGLMGEIYPEVIENWKLDKPVVAFELDVTKILKLLPSK